MADNEDTRTNLEFIIHSSATDWKALLGKFKETRPSSPTTWSSDYYNRLLLLLGSTAPQLTTSGQACKKQQNQACSSIYMPIHQKSLHNLNPCSHKQTHAI